MTIEKDLKICDILGVTDLRHYIAQTSKGELTLQIRKGESQYRFVLDAVPVSDEVHEQLMGLLFPPKPIPSVPVSVKEGKTIPKVTKKPK